MAARPTPGQPRPHRRLRARARGPACSPSERPRRACARRTGGLRLFEQEGGHISRSQRSSPHPPGIRLRDSPFSQPDRSPSQELPQQQPPGPHGRLPHRPALQPVCPWVVFGPPTSPCPAGHSGSKPSSDRLEMGAWSWSVGVRSWAEAHQRVGPGREEPGMRG